VPATGAHAVVGLVDAVRLYNATQRLLGIDATQREAMVRCVAGGSCGWLRRPLEHLCGRAPDEHLLERAFASPRLASWMLRGVTAFLLPAPPPASRRRTGMLDGDAPAERAADPSGMLVSSLMDVQSTLQALTASLAASSQPLLAPWKKSSEPLFGAEAGRRLGLWNPQGIPSFTRTTGTEEVRAFVRTVPTLRSDSARSAAERGISAVEHAMTRFATKVYLELPMEQKVNAAAAMNKDVAAVQRVLTFLKGTSLVRSIQSQMGLTEADARDALAYAAGDEALFPRVAAALRARLPASLAEEERDALVAVLDAARPLARSLAMGVVWLRAQ